MTAQHQARARVIVEGGGSVASTDAAIGQTTLPIDDGSWYQDGGGTVVSGPQRIAYTGVSGDDGTGSKIGGKSGLAPGIPTATVVADTAGNLSTGAYRYAAAFAINGGLTEGGNNSSAVTITEVSEPSRSVTYTPTTGGSLVAGAAYVYLVTFITATGETAGTAMNIILLGGANTRCDLANIPTSSDDRVTKRGIYRTVGNPGFAAPPGSYGLLTILNDNSTTTYNDTTADGSLGANPPAVSTAGNGQISVTNIPTGPTGTTARDLYRSPVNVVSNSGYKFLTRIPGNVTTTYTDNTADAELGAPYPLTSTVGPFAGDTSLPVQECSVFSASGGWADVGGGQLVRFTGRSTSSGPGTLTGVPSSGTGALTSSVPYDTPIINHPHLTGVTGVLYPINRGDSVNLLVTVNDTAAQAAMAALVGGDGIHEEYIQDRRLSETEATARGTAHLALTKDPLVTIQYETRDQTTRSGRTVTFNLAAPTSISGTFLIQSVTIDRFDPLGRTFPRRTVQASSRRFSFDDLLRQIKGT